MTAAVNMQYLKGSINILKLEVIFMYTYKKYKFPSVIMHEYHFTGNYGAKGEKRQPKSNFTPEQIKAHNQKHKEKKVQLLILENFKEGDYYTTLTYPKGTRKCLRLIQDDLKVFLDKMRRAYKRRGSEFRFISRIEIGSKGGAHIHLIINRIQDTDLLIASRWKYGHAHNTTLTDEDPTYGRLAEYMTKPPTEEALKILSTLGDSEDTTKLVRYSCSRNLKRPEPEVRQYRNRSMRKILNGEIRPTDGYFIDKCVHPPVRGVNPFTGRSFLSYQEIRLTGKVKAESVRFCECPVCHQFTLDNVTCNCQKIRKRGKRYG